MLRSWRVVYGELSGAIAVVVSIQPDGSAQCSAVRLLLAHHDGIWPWISIGTRVCSSACWVISFNPSRTSEAFHWLVALAEANVAIINKSFAILMSSRF